MIIQRFGIIKHLLDRASSDIRFVVQIETDVGLSNISFNLHNKSNVRRGSVQQVDSVASCMTSMMISTFTLSTNFPFLSSNIQMAHHMVIAFHSLSDMQDAAHIMMILVDIIINF